MFSRFQFAEFHLAQLTVQDGYMIVGADGDDMENESVPFHCTTSFIFPVGYAKKYSITLVPPGGGENFNFEF